MKAYNEIDWESMGIGIACFMPVFMATIILVLHTCWWSVLLFLVCLPVPVFPTGAGAIPLTLATYAGIRTLIEKAKK